MHTQHEHQERIELDTVRTEGAEANAHIVDLELKALRHERISASCAGQLQDEQQARGSEVVRALQLELEELRTEGHAAQAILHDLHGKLGEQQTSGSEAARTLQLGLEELRADVHTAQGTLH